jgi:hypothetical protein
VAAGCEQISQADAALTNAFELFRRRTMIAEKGAQLRAPSGATALGMTSPNTTFRHEASSLAKPDGVNGPPRFDKNTNGEAGDASAPAMLV